MIPGMKSKAKLVFRAQHLFHSSQIKRFWLNWSFISTSELTFTFSTILIIAFQEITYLLKYIYISICHYLAQFRMFSHFGPIEVIENFAIRFTESAVSFGKYIYACFWLCLPYPGFGDLTHANNSLVIFLRVTIMWWSSSLAMLARNTPPG